MGSRVGRGHASLSPADPPPASVLPALQPQNGPREPGPFTTAITVIPALAAVAVVATITSITAIAAITSSAESQSTKRQAPALV